MRAGAELSGSWEVGAAAWIDIGWRPVVHGRSTARKQPTVRSLDLPPWRGPLEADLALASRAEPFSAPDWVFELK